MSLWPATRQQWLVWACNALAGCLLLGALACIILHENLAIGVIMTIAAVMAVRILVITIPEVVDPLPPRDHREKVSEPAIRTSQPEAGQDHFRRPSRRH